MSKSEHEQQLRNYVSTHNGKKLDQKKMLAPNEMVKKVMVARFLSMTPAQRKSLRAIITPETIPALNILMPGIVNMLERMKDNAGPTG